MKQLGEGNREKSNELRWNPKDPASSGWTGGKGHIKQLENLRPQEEKGSKEAKEMENLKKL